MLESIGIAPQSFVLTALTELLASFATHVRTPYLDDLSAAARLRRQDRNQTAAESADLPRTVELARSVARP